MLIIISNLNIAAGVVLLHKYNMEPTSQTVDVLRTEIF